MTLKEILNDLSYEDNKDCHVTFRIKGEEFETMNFFKYSGAIILHNSNQIVIDVEE